MPQNPIAQLLQLLQHTTAMQHRSPGRSDSGIDLTFLGPRQPSNATAGMALMPATSPGSGSRGQTSPATDVESLEAEPTVTASGASAPPPPGALPPLNESRPAESADAIIARMTAAAGGGAKGAAKGDAKPTAKAAAKETAEAEGTTKAPPAVLKRPAAAAGKPVLKRPAASTLLEAADAAYTEAYEDKFNRDAHVEHTKRVEHAQRAGQKARKLVMSAGI